MLRGELIENGVSMTIDNIINAISSKTPMAFSRWGDGEWYNVNKLPGQNCDGNIYFPDLGDELKSIVTTPCDYYMGVQSLIDYSVQQARQYPQKWCDADIFHKASMDNQLQPFIDSLQSAHVVYIGNQSLNALPFINEFIEIPYNNVWLQRKELMELIHNVCDGTFKVFCFSAGMAANVFIHDSWNLNKTNIYLDVGSVFDPYVGRNTRSYHRRLTHITNK